MSPRSEEFAAQARDRLAAARDPIDAVHFGVAVGIAYYAMLYAVRVALSERDMNAKTHGGTRALVAEQLVQDGSMRDGCASATSAPTDRG